MAENGKTKQNDVITFPGFLYREFRSKHDYHLYGNEMTGVTSVLKSAGDSSNLMQWYANLAAAAAFGIGTPAGWHEAYEQVIQKYGKLNREAAYELDALFPQFKEARTASLRVRDRAADVGKAAHKACEEFELGRRDFSHLDENVRKRFEPYPKWYTENVERTLFVERPVFSKSMFVGGTPDGGFVTKDGKNLINDKKFKEGIGSPHPHWQMACYRAMIEEMAQDTETPVRLELADGTIEEYTNPQEYLGSIGSVKWDGSVILLMDPTMTVKPIYRYAYEQDLAAFKAALLIHREEAQFKS